MDYLSQHLTSSYGGLVFLWRPGGGKKPRCQTLQLGLVSLPESYSTARNAEALAGSCSCFSFQWSVCWLFDRDTHRGGPVSSHSPPPLPVPPAVGTEPGRHRPHASPTQSSHCCPGGGAAALAAPFPSWLCTSLATGKASLAFRKFPLCVALCRAQLCEPRSG